MGVERPYHPAFGLTEKLRLEACSDAVTLGSAKLAAELHVVSTRSVYSWLKHYSRLKAQEG